MSASASSSAASSSKSKAKGAIPEKELQQLAQIFNVPPTSILLTAIGILHYRYTGLTECDIRLRLSSLPLDSTNSPSDAAPANAVNVSLVLKNTQTFEQLVQHVHSTLVAAAPTFDINATTFNLEFYQIISQELASSGFQHLLHISILGNGSGKKHKVSARYEYPPMLTAGQADPRTRVSLHLPGIVSGMADLHKSKGPLPQVKIHELQFLPQEERKNLMQEWSGLHTFDSVDRTDQLLHEMFEATAAKFPQRIAIECAAPMYRQMTYAAMSRRTNQLARWMRNNGVSVGSYVGMWLPRSMEVYIALISILKAGAAYVPIDPEYPSDRVSFILEDCKAPILVTHSELIDSHPDFVLPPGCQMIQYDKVDELMEEQDDTFPTREQTGQTNRDVCYVIYTSGSTGRPKGCCLEHRSAVNLVRAERILFGVHEKDRVYQGFSIAFDASVEEVWMAFASGATLVAATPDMLHAGPSLPSMLVEQRITVISTVPTLLSMMEDTLPDVRILISGGEAVQKDLIKRWGRTKQSLPPATRTPPVDLAAYKARGFEQMGQYLEQWEQDRIDDPRCAPGNPILKRRFINTYGPTEATVIATHVDTDPDAPLVTIGKAVPSYFLYILDANLNPCPVGVGGELHIGGLCVARGYLMRPELTKEKFIPFPREKLYYQSSDEKDLDTIEGSSPRLYKAGDLCRWTEDGEVEFCGRIDQQVKLRGYRVELSEIESVLMTQPNIQSACVSVREDVPGIQNLIGYVILKNVDLPFNQDELKEGIRVRLPPYMVPACIDVLTKFPTLPSGKVNRKELPAPKNLVVVNYDDEPEEEANGGSEVVPKNLDEANKSDADPNYFPPRSSLEKTLAKMWRKLFQRPKISTTDDFFTLGGHSLLAAWLVSALRKESATEHVTMADVYGFPKLRDMACKLSGGDPAELPEPGSAEEAAMYAASSSGSGGSGSGSEESKDSEEANDADGMGGAVGGELGSENAAANAASEAAKADALAHYAPISNARFIICNFFQLLALYFLYALPALQIGIPWELYLKIRDDGWQYIIIMLLPFSVAIFPIYVFFAIAAKWILIGKYREGKHQLWGWYYFRWWLVQRLVYYIPLIYLRGSPVLNHYFRLMGAKIGKNVFLNSHLIEAPDLVDIGDDSSIGIDAQIINFHVEGNWLYIRKVKIGACCYVGARSVVSGGSAMEDHAQLGAMSLLTQGQVVPQWEHWRGSPAIKTARVENYMPKSVVHAGANVAMQGNTNRGSNGKKAALNDDSVSVSIISSSLSPAQQEALYDDDDEEEDQRQNKKKSSTGKFLDDSLSEHLLSSSDALAAEAENGSIYIGVGEESIAWHHARPTSMQRFLLGFGQSCVLTILLPCLILISLAPGMYLLHRLMPTDLSIHNIRYESNATWLYLAACAPMALSFTILLCWQITVIKWILMGQIQPGDYKVHSWFYLRKWTVDTLMQLSIQVVHPIYSTMFLVPWFRSLGAIIGDNCEIATAVYAAPDLIEVGSECFIADTVYLGVPAVHMGTIRLAKIRLGDRVFVGNGACLPMQTQIGSNCLVGVMSAPPLAHPLGDATAVMHWPEPALRCDNGTAWLGNPAMFLPHRQPPKGHFDDSVLYHPSFFLIFGRLVMEFIKLTLPFLLFILSMLVLMGDFQLIRVRFQYSYQFWLIWPLLYMGAGVACCFIVLLMKWLLIGKFIAGEHALWSSFIWRHDLVVALLDSLAHPYFINQLRGTAFVNMWFRMLGSEIGSRVWMDTTSITEPDLVHIGDDTAVHNDAQIQTHLFEDRILKMSHTKVGSKCSIGNSAIVLYDSVMHDGSHLLPLSLLMKAESLQAWSSWQGVPAHQVSNDHWTSWKKNKSNSARSL